MRDRVSATVSKPVKDWLAEKAEFLDLSESATVAEVLKDAMRRERSKAARLPQPSPGGE